MSKNKLNKETKEIDYLLTIPKIELAKRLIYSIKNEEAANNELKSIQFKYDMKLLELLNKRITTENDYKALINDKNRIIDDYDNIIKKANYNILKLYKNKNKIQHIFCVYIIISILLLISSIIWL